MGPTVDFALVSVQPLAQGQNRAQAAALLERAGYLTVQKGFVGKLPRTTLSLSAAGCNAWKAHLTALREIVEG